jgi:hypothetical protein
MKKFFLFILMLFAANVYAQENTYNMVIEMANGSKITIGPNEVKNITFNDGQITVSGQSIEKMADEILTLQKEGADTRAAIDNTWANIEALKTYMQSIRSCQCDNSSIEARMAALENVVSMIQPGAPYDDTAIRNMIVTLESAVSNIMLQVQTLEATVASMQAGSGGGDAHKACPDANHPHMIDLGLPSGTKWACCNVGANAPEQYGNYYAWGETQPKEVYDWETYQYGSSEENVVNIGSDIAGTGYDAATANWGTPWRMPTKTQWDELIGNCSSEWMTQNGVKGLIFTGSNGGTIFLPAAGLRWDSELNYADLTGCCWSSTLGESYPYYASYLDFGSDRVGADGYGSRFRGQSVRPVR